MSLIQTNFTEAPPAPPNVMIIFGAGGDLTRRKLIPALFNLSAAGLLPEGFAMLGLDRLDLDDQAFRERIAGQVEDSLGAAFDRRVWEGLVSRIHYMQIDMLEMVLAKTDPELFGWYQQRLVEPEDRGLGEDLRQRVITLAQDLLRLRGERDPRLRDSLTVRNTYLDPLHLLQAELLARSRAAVEPPEEVERALQVTMAGISSGLRNTG